MPLSGCTRSQGCFKNPKFRDFFHISGPLPWQLVYLATKFDFNFIPFTSRYKYLKNFWKGNSGCLSYSLKMNWCDHLIMSKIHILSLFRAAFTQIMMVSPLILFFHCNKLFMRFNKVLFEFSLFLHFWGKTPPKMLLKTGFWQSAKPLSI